METLAPAEDSVNFELTSEDLLWLQSFGVEADNIDEEVLQGIISAGSDLITDEDYEASRNRIVTARSHFFRLLNIESAFPNDSKNDSPRFIPIDTFIKSQREMYRAGLNAFKIIKSLPQTASLAPDSVRAKIDNFSDLGLDPSEVINSLPSLMGLAPDSVRAKIDNLNKLGFNAVKMINKCPMVLNLAPASLRGKIEDLSGLGLDARSLISSYPNVLIFSMASVEAKMKNLTRLGLDAVKVISRSPSCIGLSVDLVRNRVNEFASLGVDPIKMINTKPAVIVYTPESIKSKLDNLAELGLDAVNIVNSFPAVIGYSTELVTSKMRLIERSARLLKWEGETEDFINKYPVILGFSKKKLQIFRRIAATTFIEDSRDATTGQIRTALILPIEKYIVGFSKPDSKDVKSVREGANMAKRVKLGSAERKQQAKEIAIEGELGRVGIMYLNYST